MQLKKITFAVAAALAVSPAFALFDPIDVPSASTTKIYLTGATAPDGFIAGAVTDMLDVGFKTYRNDDLSQAFQYRAWFGAAKAGIPGVTAGTAVLLIKRSKGGSVWGVDPVALGSRIQSLDFTTCGASGAHVADGTTYTYLCGTKGLDPDSPNFTSATLNTGDVSDVGVSDVAPFMFKGPYNLEFGTLVALPAITNASINGGGGLDALDIKAVNTLMMGIVATNSVPATTRFSTVDYANMLAGNVQTWSKVDPSLTTGNTHVVVCRRVNGSGTQASYNWYFNHFPCQNAFAGVMAPADMTADSASGIVNGDGSVGFPFEIDPTVGLTVVNNSTSGDVRNCLIKANTFADHAFKGDDGFNYLIKFSNSTTPFRAIGLLSVDSYNSTGSGSNGEGTNWTFRMLDGAGTYAPGTDVASVGATGTAPSKANLLSGAYPFAAELTMQYRKLAVKNPQGDSIAALAAGTKKAFTDEFIKRAGDPVKIGLNSKHKAFAALPELYSAITNPAQVAKGYRKGNMCAPLKRLY